MSKYGPTNRHHVVLQSNQLEHRVHIDGHDVSNSLRSATLDLTAGQPPIITLELARVDGLRTDLASAVVALTTADTELLTSLGWTPPPETAP